MKQVNGLALRPLFFQTKKECFSRSLLSEKKPLQEREQNV
jgi:hypothetical protein